MATPKPYKCGPSATETNRDPITEGSCKIIEHQIDGSGAITSCSVKRLSEVPYQRLDRYYILFGITELADDCFNSKFIGSVSLPSGLRSIGNRCFQTTKIESITLPESLLSIGHKNFPATLKTLHIPAGIKDFPIDNIEPCQHLESITVAPQNTSYKVVDGILYNYDMTEALFCFRNKRGVVVIPNSVKRIGSLCFAYCAYVEQIHLPLSIETIGDFAFFSVKMDKLIIPNSVKSIGTGCFSLVDIKKKFQLSKCITKLPPLAFSKAKLPNFSFENLVALGEKAFYNIKFYDSISKVSFPNIESLGTQSFMSDDGSNIHNYELFYRLNQIGDNAFDGISDLTIRYNSFVPLQTSGKAFASRNNTTLIVPIGCKVIFGSTLPWSAFSSIIERNFDEEQDEQQNSTDVFSTELYRRRIASVADSIKNANRVYLKELIEEVSFNYQDIDSDEEYDEALQLIKYNRTFKPAIVDDLESKICKNWDCYYKLKFANELLCTPNMMLPTVTNVSVPVVEELPVFVLPQEQLLASPSEATPIEVHFQDILKYLQNELSLAKSSLKIAVSWFTNYALFKQVKDLAEEGVHVQLIINNDLINNGGYCLDFNQLIEAGVELSLVEYPHLLHDKFCIIDEHVVINGSYNWTRFSASNYENITIFRDNDEVTSSFCEEFDIIWEKAEYKCVQEMPDTVPDKPEYDRSSFKQYVTEELDAEGREAADERDKITAFHKAEKVNASYFAKINPQAGKDYAEQMKIAENSETVQQYIAQAVVVSSASVHPNTGTSVAQTLSQSTPAGTPTGSSAGSSKPTVINATTPSAMIQDAISKVKASSLFMAIDYSGSMKNCYLSGNAHKIIIQALTTALSISENQKLSLWTFTETAQCRGNFGITDIDSIKQINNPGGGTKLSSFIQDASSSMKDGSLVLVFTDGDDSACSNVAARISKLPNVFWQIIGYGDKFDNLKNLIDPLPNAACSISTNFDSLSQQEQQKLFLAAYLNWKLRKNK